MKQNLAFALFCALVTAVMSFPLLGLKMTSQGTGMIIEGASPTTWAGISAACVLVFLTQLFKNPINQITSGIRSIMPSLPVPNLRDETRQKLEKVSLLCLIGLALVWPFLASRGAVDLATLVLIYVMLGLGLNIVVGLAGLLDLGYVAFYAVGAYSYALLSSYFGFSFWATLPIAGLLAATFGFLLGFPVLRLRGDYLAIVTLGFGEIIRIFLNNLTSLTGGPNGIGNIPKPTLPMLQTDPELTIVALEFSRTTQTEGNIPFHTFFGLDYNPGTKVLFLFLLALVMCLATIYVIRRLIRMPVGRAWEALREDEIACRSLGLNRTRIKLDLVNQFDTVQLSRFPHF
jgi:branched-chain amino acid transport system permease protein